MSETSSLAVILPRMPSGASHTLLDAVAPDIASKLGDVFSRTAFCYRYAPEDENWRRISPRLLDNVELLPVYADSALAASRALAARLADKTWSVILAVADCSLLHAIIALRAAGLAFAQSQLVGIVDGGAEIASGSPGGTDLLLGRKLHDAAVRALDRVIDIKTAGTSELAMVAGMLERLAIPAPTSSPMAGSERKWAILGPHASKRLNELLDTTDIGNIGVIGERNCAAVERRSDLDRFDLIPHWGREAILRYLVFEQRIALLPPGMGIERLDCLVLGVPVAEDFVHYQTTVLPPAEVHEIFSRQSQPAATRPSRGSSALQRLRRLMIGSDMTSLKDSRSDGLGGAAVKLNWELEDRDILLPPCATLRPAAAAALAQADADIVISGIKSEDADEHDLVVDPLAPTLCPPLFRSGADGCVYLLRTWVSRRFGSDTDAIADAAANGASVLAVPIAAAVMNARDANALQLRLASRTAGTLTATMAPIDSETIQAILQPATAKRLPMPARRAHLLDLLRSPDGVRRARAMVAAEQANEIAQAQRAIEIGESLRLKVAVPVTMQLELAGHCCFAASLAEPLPRPILFSMEFAGTDAKPPSTTKTVLPAGADKIIVFFLPRSGAETVSLHCTGDASGDDLVLLTPTLHTPGSLRAGHELQVAPGRPGGEIGSRTVGHAGG
jgi:hypothetical protein